MKIISYSFFIPKKIPTHRDHDQWLLDGDRYWFNLPCIAALNSFLFPEHTTVFYTSDNVKQHRLYSVLEILQEFRKVKIENVSMDYSFTEPAIWRMMPIWQRDAEICHTRDVDSVITKDEFRYMSLFEKSNHSVGTIRTHPNHHGIKCRMLAGLSSFSPKNIPPHIKGMDFNFYYSLRHSDYGSDQDLMISRFTTDPAFTSKNFLDYATYHQTNPQNFPCIEARKEEVEAIDVCDAKVKVFDKMQVCGLDNWSGEPVDARGEFTTWLLEYVAPELKDRLTKDEVLKAFYKL